MMTRWGGAEQGRRVIRSTVIVDPKGNVAHHFPKVSPRGHAEEVIAKLKELQKAQEKSK